MNTDPVPVLLDDLDRRCRDLGEPRGTDVPTDPHVWLGNIVTRFELIRLGPHTPAEQQQIEQLDGDIEHVRLLIGDR